jgi:hypothetical protein
LVAPPTSAHPPPPPPTPRASRRPPPPPPKRASKPPKPAKAQSRNKRGATLPPPTLQSSHVRLLADAALDGALLAVAASATNPGDKAPRYIAAGDDRGALHVFDGAGRPALPAESIVGSAGRILSLAFLSAATAAKHATGPVVAAHILAAAVVDDARSNGGASFSLCIYRVAPSRAPSPERRATLELLHEHRVEWPALAVGETLTGQTAIAASASSDSAALAKPGAAGAQRLVSIESLAGLGAAQSKAGPSLLAVRSDGLVVALAAARGTMLQAIHTGGGIEEPVHASRRGAAGVALLSPTRLTVVELKTRGPPRDCALPASLTAAGGRLTGVAFDVQLPQLLYATTSLGETLLYNSRARAPPPPPLADGRVPAPPAECHWLDTLVTEPDAGDAEPIESVAAVRGFLLHAGAASFGATLAPLVHAEPLPAWGGGGGGGVFGGRRRGGGDGSDVRPLVVAGNTVRERESAGESTLSSAARPTPPPARPHTRLPRAPSSIRQVILGGEGRRSLLVYTAALTYEPLTRPKWPQYVMAISVLVITAFWQMYKKSQRGKEEANAAAQPGRGGPRGRARNRAEEQAHAAELRMKAYGFGAGDGVKSGKPSPMPNPFRSGGGADHGAGVGISGSGGGGGDDSDESDGWSRAARDRADKSMRKHYEAHRKPPKTEIRLGRSDRGLHGYHEDDDEDSD